MYIICLDQFRGQMCTCIAVHDLTLLHQTRKTKSLRFAKGTIFKQTRVPRCEAKTIHLLSISSKQSGPGAL